jgi:dihydroflavonol-4-reductase
MRRAAVGPVLVTGASGFIGSRVARLLCAEGRRLHCLVRPSSRLDRIDVLPATFFPGDLADSASLQKAAEGCEACIHLAGPSGWEAQAGADLEGTIVGGMARLLDALRRAGTRRLVHVSSAAAVDGTTEPRLLNEESPFTLAGSGLAYAVAKHRAERLALAAVADGLEVVVVNPAETYGPGDRDWITAGSIRDVLSSWPALVVRGGTSLAHVDDVAHGIVAALHRGRAGERYILGGENLMLAEIVATVLDLAGLRRPIVTVPFPLLRAAVAASLALGLKPPVEPALLFYLPRFWFLDSGKARRELGYAPRPARDTLQSVVRWITEQAPDGGGRMTGWPAAAAMSPGGGR